MYQTIVVGAHKSQSARAALDEAKRLAQVLHAHLHLVAADPKDEGPRAGPDTPGRVDAEQMLEALAPAAASLGYATHALPGDPAKAILTVADEVGADLIVVGNKGMKGTRRFLGSVPNDVAHRANCAVLIVNTT